MTLKENRSFYFSVEGQTEKWYFEWLQNIINAEPASKYKVKIDVKKENPLSRIKQLSVIGKTDITHICDYEGNEEEFQRKFMNTLDQMKAAEKSGKNIKYHLGYSNLTFELWMIIHKINFTCPLAHRNQYLAHLNRAYDEQFNSLNEYKEENNFKRLLSKLTLEDIRQAVDRAIKITNKNEENRHVLQQYKGYTYYRENPSLSVWTSVKTILKTCELI